MNKITVLIGTHEASATSDAHKIAGIIGAKLREREAAEIEILCLADYRIDMCTGCLACARTGACVLSDDLPVLLEEFLAADHLMVISSVYAHHIPGHLKNLFDRSRYWLPVMKLLGKTSSSVMVTPWDDQLYASDYLEKILKLLGTIHIRALDIPHAMTSFDMMETDILINRFVREVCQSLTRDFPLDNLTTQIGAFNKGKALYAKADLVTVEGRAWKNVPALQQKSFLDAWQYQRATGQSENENEEEVAVQ